MKWKKPNGNEIEVNDDKETREYCLSLGWEPLNGTDIEEPEDDKDEE
jgi:hypothetical protein